MTNYVHHTLSRRTFLCTTAATAAGAVLMMTPALRSAFAQNDTVATDLRIASRTLDVNGKPAKVFGIQQSNGTSGLTLIDSQPLNVNLINNCGEETIIHWHGQTPPYTQDGVMDHARSGLASRASRIYNYPARAGTHWMHSHHGLQEQRLMAAPLIVRTADDLNADMQEITILLHDFSFEDPNAILAGLKKSPPSMAEMPGMDVNDINYDAFLANDRTFDDPEVIAVEHGSHVRLRIINGATTTAFWIDLGTLKGKVIAVDGTPIIPVSGHIFPVSMGQRLDIVIALPHGAMAWPITAQREGAVEHTGIILASRHASVSKIASAAHKLSPIISNTFEKQLHAATPLAERNPDAVYSIELTGTMEKYNWSLNGQTYGDHTPINVRHGQRIALDFINQTTMAHPMHLHGHTFQVTYIDGRAVQGAMRDTVHVPVNSTIRVTFDATNPGSWPLHCHNLMHMASGMMTDVVYV